MSEYQYIEFRAVDKPLTDKQLEFAETQSTRAEISQWSFTNEYHYGDFHGNIHKLMRGGYDVHLHYANYGTRRVALRLPNGLPFDKRLWKQYCADKDESFSWHPDRKGPGGIIEWCPFHDAGSIEEEWEPQQYVADCIALRERLIQGDLRALYAIWLCTISGDDGDWEGIEPPVPVGLSESAGIFGNLLWFYGVDPLTLVAASEGIPPLTDSAECGRATSVKTWISKTKVAQARELLERFLTEDPIGVKAELLAEIRDGRPSASWPHVPGTRSFQQLRSAADALRDKINAAEKKKEAQKAKRAAAKAEKVRKKRMKQMSENPQKWLVETENLVKARGRDNYHAAAEILADMREALGETEDDSITRKHAAHLCKKHPTLTQLKGAMRKQGLVD